MELNDLRGRLIALPRRWKQVILVLGDLAILSTALLLACFYVTQGNGWPAIRAGWLHFPLMMAVAVPLFIHGGFYRTVIRFVGTQLPVTVFLWVTVLALFMMAARSWLPLPGLALPRPTILAFWAFAIFLLIGSRWLMRYLLISAGCAREPVVIYGAGAAGMKLMAGLSADGRFQAIAFVDENPSLHGRLLNGVRIRPPAELPMLVTRYQARRVLLAIPSASRQKRREIIEGLASLPVHVQTMPDIADLAAGRARVHDLQDVGALDLLGREPVPPNQELLGRCIRDKVVMVTGAGGSIGSELCRQIVALEPRRLVLFELAELNLYSIDHELRRMVLEQGLEVEIVPLLGSVHSRGRVESVMRTFGVQTVYHAAAYKHVPIVEANLVEGVHNNIIGTWHAAEAAEAARVEVFVLVSTDKAVMPVNVMGATKPFAELVLQGMAQRGSRTRFCMVRFGNVLESSGSVVPLFRRQILAGGPVTVTHPEVIRYFMTIPEAAQLVIQAGAMGKGGDVFVLDMGEPVRIADLALRMIHLMGRTVRDEANPEGDIALEFTGLRPGEKLYEELLIGSNVERTAHPMIMQAFEEFLPWPRLHQHLAQVLAAADAGDCVRAQALLQEAVRGYHPVCPTIQDLLWRASKGSAGGPAAPDLPATPPIRLVGGTEA